MEIRVTKLKEFIDQVRGRIDYVKPYADGEFSDTVIDLDRAIAVIEKLDEAIKPVIQRIDFMEKNLGNLANYMNDGTCQVEIKSLRDVRQALADCEKILEQA